MYLAYPKLEIYWQATLNINQSSLLYSQNNGGGWDTVVYNFYKMQLSQILMCENRIVYFSLKLYCRLGQIILADFLTKRHVTKKKILYLLSNYFN